MHQLFFVEIEYHLLAPGLHVDLFNHDAYSEIKRVLIKERYFFYANDKIDIFEGDGFYVH